MGAKKADPVGLGQPADADKLGFKELPVIVTLNQTLQLSKSASLDDKALMKQFLTHKGVSILD